MNKKTILFLSVWFFLLMFGRAAASISVHPGTLDQVTLKSGNNSSSWMLNSRHFTADLYKPGQKDSVLFSRSVETVVICRGQAAEACQTFRLDGAVEVIPMSGAAPATSSLVVFDRQGGVSVCTIDQTGNLACSARTPDEVGPKSKLLGNGPAQLLRVSADPDRYGCLLRIGHFVTCNSAHSLTPAGDGALLFGNFSGGVGLEALQVRNGVAHLCEVSAAMVSCRSATGLHGLVGVGVRVATIYSSRNNQSRLVLLSNTRIAVCDLRGIGDQGYFSCDVETVTGNLDRLRAFIVTNHTSQGVATSEQLLLAPKFAEMKTAQKTREVHADVRETGSKYRKSYMRSTQTGNMPNKMYGIRSEPQAIAPPSPSLCEDSCGGFSDIFSEGAGPELFSSDVQDSGGNLVEADEAWTDEVGVGDLWQYNNYVDQVPPDQRQQCLTICDRDQQTRNDTCYALGGFFSGLTVAASFAGAVLASETGPGSFAVAKTTFEIGAALTGAFITACIGVSSDSAISCRIVCVGS